MGMQCNADGALQKPNSVPYLAPFKLLFFVVFGSIKPYPLTSVVGLRHRARCYNVPFLLPVFVRLTKQLSHIAFFLCI